MHKLKRIHVSFEAVPLINKFDVQNLYSGTFCEYAICLRMSITVCGEKIKEAGK